MMNNIEENKKQRIIYLDLLRIIAIISVIILHISAQNWSTVGIETFEWKVFNVLDSFVRWGVPIFIMISGALFLDNDKYIETKKIYSKNIFRIITAFVFWSLIYAIDMKLIGANFNTVVVSFIQGKYHMWFLFMLIMLYIMVPIFRKITESKKCTEYFLIIGIIFGILIPRLFYFLEYTDIPKIKLLLKPFNYVFLSMKSNFGFGYSIYFVLGFYLAKYDINKILRRLSYFLCLFCACAIALLTVWHSNKLGIASEGFYNVLSVNVMFMSIGIFLFVKNVIVRINWKEKSLKCIRRFSQYSFGMYLVHALILDKFDTMLGINTLSYSPIYSVIILTLGVTIVSYIVSGILNHIPVLKKYIV